MSSMAPMKVQLTTQLRHLIYYNLDNDLLSNALFLAGRLHALDTRNPEAIHLLAICYMKSGQVRTAYDFSQAPARRSLHLGCAYVFAQACLRLQRPAEGIEALDRVRQMWEGKNDWVKPADAKQQRFLPDAPAVLCLLGKLYEADKRTERAIEHYAEALKLNPFVWDAFERLCDTGTNIRTSNIFKLQPEVLAYLSSKPEILETEPALEHPAQSISNSFHPQPQNGLRPSASVDSDPFGSVVAARNGNPPASTAQSNFHMNQPRTLGNLGVNTASVAGIETPPAMQTNTTGISQQRPADPSRGSHPMDPPNAPLRKNRTGQPSSVEISADPSKPRSLSTRNRRKSLSEDPEHAGPTVTHAPAQHKRTISGSVSNLTSSSSNDLNVRRSRRLFSQIRPNSTKPPLLLSTTSDKEAEPKKARATGTKGRPPTAPSTVGRVVSGNRKPIPPEQRDAASRETRVQGLKVETRLVSERQHVRDEHHVKDTEVIQWLLDILGKLGQGYYHLSQYKCQAAIQSFYSVPQVQRETPWVLAQIGRALYEQNDYLEAEKTFARVRKLMPSSVADMEVYSTVLWHLKNDTELAFLSHELLDVQRLSPEAWCTIGNSFSLQREHDQALNCFKRATQLSPKFAYGYTLQGHEHIANEEFDKALGAYRRAISADQRHYNGWYGLGKVYEKLGDYKMAEKHYRAAASINPTNAVLYCCIGHVLEKLKQPQAALEQYRHASNLQPTASNSLYRTARVLLNLRRNQDALRVLSALKDVAPDESNVHFMLGRTHARMRNKPLAIKHYTIAMNLDPKAAPYLKEQMEGLDEEDYDDEPDDEDEEMT